MEILPINRPHKTALIVPPNTRVTYAELQNEIDILSYQLQMISEGYSSCIALVLIPANTVPYVTLFYALLKSRITVAPLNTNYKQPELQFYINDLKPTFIIVDDFYMKNHSAMLHYVMKEFDISVYKYTKGNSLYLKCIRFCQFNVWLKDEDYIAMILHTSGTTSAPKGITLHLVLH
jgi:long-subunit acyl-CoA synthetase (AMP-forming)